jgi:hypothetical protein
MNPAIIKTLSENQIVYRLKVDGPVTSGVYCVEEDDGNLIELPPSPRYPPSKSWVKRVLKQMWEEVKR